MPRDAAEDWARVQKNRTYRKGALNDTEGLGIRWHSPLAERSSQTFCISAFGELRSLPDRDILLSDLFAPALGALHRGPWQVEFEHAKGEVLGETGAGTPTHVDAYFTAPTAIVCVESKFDFDAREGFGPCSQAAAGSCAGFYGRGSDRKTAGEHFCRLEAREGRRAPRKYWSLGRTHFRDQVFAEQSAGQACPFSGSSFQLMRNFLFAAESARPDRAFAVLCMVPAKVSAVACGQIADFRAKILRPDLAQRIAVSTYDELSSRLSASVHAESRELGKFLRERMDTLL